MRDAVVQRFADGIGLVLIYLFGEQRALADVAVFEVANLGIHLIHRQQQRHAEQGVVPIVSLMVLQQPANLGLRRQQEMLRLLLAKQQQRRARDAPLDGQLCLVMNLDEGDAIGSLVGDLFLQAVQVLACRTEVGAHHLPIVVDAEDQPCRRLALQIGFIAESREILSKLGEVIAVLCLLEFHYLVFG